MRAVESTRATTLPGLFGQESNSPATFASHETQASTPAQTLRKKLSTISLKRSIGKLRERFTKNDVTIVPPPIPYSHAYGASRHSVSTAFTTHTEINRVTGEHDEEWFGSANSLSLNTPSASTDSVSTAFTTDSSIWGATNRHEEEWFGNPNASSFRLSTDSFLTNNGNVAQVQNNSGLFRNNDLQRHIWPPGQIDARLREDGLREEKPLPRLPQLGQKKNDDVEEQLPGLPLPPRKRLNPSRQLTP